MAKKNRNSTKQDNIPHDNQQRKDMIEEFVRRNKDNPDRYVVHETVPHEHDDTTRPSRGKGKRPSE